MKERRTKNEEKEKREIKREKERDKYERASTGFSKAEEEQGDGAHQSLSTESIPTGLCPSDQCFKFRRLVTFT